MPSNFIKHYSSFRDPDGFVFSDDQSIIYRQLNQSYQNNYSLLKTSGLYDLLADKSMLIKHQEITDIIFDEKNYYKTLLPEQIPFISYPYEWCFDQLKDAALLTLDIMKMSLDHGMLLKDATPFNIQLYKGKCIFIDTSSFEKYTDGSPWVAYRQFCETFLAPLVLSHYAKNNLNSFLSNFPNGIPLAIVSKLLPFRSRLNLGVSLHIHFQSSYKNKNSSRNKYVMPKRRLYALIDHLKNLIKGLSIKNTEPGWTDYYDQDILSSEYLDHKKIVIENLLTKIDVKNALDLGANNGYFSEIIAKRNIDIVAADFDAACINNLYKKNKKEDIQNISPIIIDITNPTPPIGWANQERASFIKRANFDLTIALALIHHLCIGKNIPLEKIAQTFSSFGKYLIIEFIPKNDPKVQILLQHRTDNSSEYTIENFESNFITYYDLISKESIANTERLVYLFKIKQS